MAGIRHSLRLTQRFELSSLDLLRDELTATMQLETLRARPCPRSVDDLEPTFGVLSA